MPEIAFLMGKSSSGKDNIFKALVGDKELNLKTVIMYTTRPMRAGEKEGVEYYYVDNEKALELEAADKVIEMRTYNTVYGEWKYFTVDDGQIRLGSGDKYIVIGTIEAYNKFCAYFGKEAILPIYIEVDDGIRLMRAINREQKQEVPQYEEMCRRFLAATFQRATLRAIILNIKTADSKDFSEEKIKEAGINQRFSNDGTIEDCIRDIKEAIKQQLL
mgnify:CR=1 FL=1